MPSPSPSPSIDPGAFVSLTQSRDSFTWLADFWIPVIGIVATVAVSAIALIASNRAQKLAGQLEAQRDADQRRRYEEERARRLREMAIEEARALYRWLAEANRRRGWFRTGRGINESPPPREPHEQAQVDAEVMLQQSIVPGAQELFEITAFDLKHRWSLLPDSDIEELQDVRTALVRERQERTRSRIREWALDPEGESESIADELGSIEIDKQSYLLVGHELTWEFESQD